MSNSVTPWTAVRQASLSINNNWSLLKLMSIESVMLSNHLILCCPLLLLPSIFPSIRVFSNTSQKLIYNGGGGGGLVAKSCLTLATPWTAACQAPLSFTLSWSLLRLKSIESVMLSNHLILCCPLLLLPPIFSSIRVFSSESACHVKWPKYWSFSFTISPFNEYSGLFALGLTSLISLQSKGLSRVFSSTTVWKNQFFGTQSSLWSNSHIHTWLLENHSFDCTDLCQQSNVSAF